MIEAELLADPAAYLAAAGPLLAADRARSTIIATVATGLMAAPFGSAAPLLMLVRNGGDVVAAAMQTPPHPLSVLVDRRVNDRASLFDALAAALQSAGARPTLLTGPRTDVTDLAGAMVGSGGVVAREHTAMLLYRLGELAPPHGVPGTVRLAEPADPADRELLARWFYEFEMQTDSVPRPAAPDPDVLESRHARGNRHMLWEVDGAPVSLAGHSAVVDGMSRISAVYTPERLRRHGYASAVTAAAALAAGRAGADEVVLFTDAAYAPSNAVYRRLGFVPAEEFCEITVQPAGPSGGGSSNAASASAVS